MYKLTILNRYGEVSVIQSDDLGRLKIVAERMNKNGCDVEITKQEVLFRIVNMNK